MTLLQLLKLILKCCLLSYSNRPLPVASFAVVQHVHARHAALLSVSVRATALLTRHFRDTSGVNVRLIHNQDAKGMEWAECTSWAEQVRQGGT